MGSVAVIILFFLSHGCDPAPTHKTDKKKVEAIVKDVYKVDTATIRKSQILQLKNDSLENENSRLRLALKSTNRQVDRVNDKLTGLINDNETLKRQGDTVGRLQNCDSLAETAGQLVDQVQVLQVQNEQLQANQELQLRIKDSIAAEKERALSAFRIAMQEVSGEYDDLYHDYRKEKRRANNAQVISDVQWVALAAAAIKIFLIK